MKHKGPLNERVHAWLVWRLWHLDENYLCEIKNDRIADALLGVTEFAQKVLCRVLGHMPIADQCGIPAHDYCAWCNKSMPDQARERVRSA